MWSLWSGPVWLVIAGAVGLFLASRLKTVLLSLFAHTFGAPAGTWFYIALTLPGFFLHEAAHWLAAVLLRVPVRRARLIPRPAADGGSFVAFVELERRDPLRMALVALAPFLLGLLALALVTALFPYDVVAAYPWARLGGDTVSWGGEPGKFWLLGYSLWAISSHMAPSGGDLKHAWKGVLIVAPVLIVVGWLFARVSPDLPQRWQLACTRLGDGFALASAWNALWLLFAGALYRVLKGR
jgi:ABC-type amino acid transport system permease subunit